MAPLMDKGQKLRLLEGLSSLYKEQELTDIILAVEDREFKCHKNVLAASSPYFRAMFTRDVIESASEKVQLYGVAVDALGAIIQYLYTGEIEITNATVQNIFTTASLFEILSLCEMCTKHMISELHVSNCLEVYQFGSFHSWNILKEAACQFAVDYFDDISHEEGWNSLTWQEIVDVLSKDELNAAKEETVYELLLSWMKSNESNLQYLSKLFKVIRPALLSNEYIKEKVETDSIVSSCQTCKAYLPMVKLYHTAASVDNTDEELESLSRDLDLNTVPRLGMFNKKMMVFMGGSQEKCQRALACFDPVTKRNYYAVPFHVSFDFKYRIDYHRAAVTKDNHLYLIGGIFYEDHHFEAAGPALRQVKVFDPCIKQWTDKAPLLEPRCAHAVVTCDDKIYAIGGKSFFPGGEALASVECYDPGENQWTFVASMPERLFHHSAVQHNGRVFVAGGMVDLHQASEIFLQYDTLNDSWIKQTKTMQVPRAEFGMTLVGNEIFVIGGTDGSRKLSSMEVYNIDTSKWRFGEDFPEDRKCMACVAFDEDIYVCGGVRTIISRLNRTPRIVETKDLWRYDIKSEKWTREAKLVEFANIHACVVAEVNTKRLRPSEFVSSG